MTPMHAGEALVGRYDYPLVALSVLIAMGASYVALDLAGRVVAARGRARWTWWAGGAVSMGLGIWSMHYIGMLAFTLPVPVLYDLPGVLLSLLAAVVASGVALFVVSRKTLDWIGVVAGSIVMGAGIAAMHYVGMEAMRLPAMCHYDRGLVALSVVIAVVVSLVALWLAFRFRTETRELAPLKIASAVVMGIAVAGMHYTGMAAVSFVPAALTGDVSNAVSISSLGIASIAHGDLHGARAGAADRHGEPTVFRAVPRAAGQRGAFSTAFRAQPGRRVPQHRRRPPARLQRGLLPHLRLSVARGLLARYGDRAGPRPGRPGRLPPGAAPRASGCPMSRACSGGWTAPPSGCCRTPASCRTTPTERT